MTGRWAAGPLLPAAMLVLGVVVAGLVAAMPQASLDLLMWRLWLPRIVPAATPPVGVTGRTALAILALAPFVAGALALRVWRGRGMPATAAAQVPTVRRADAHPDAPPRRPIRASADLGPPLPIVAGRRVRGVSEPERPLPADLDQPLAAFDPVAVPDVPRQPVRAVAPLTPPPVAAQPMSVVSYAWGEETAEEEVAEPPVLPFLAIAPEPEPTPEPITAPSDLLKAIEPVESPSSPYPGEGRVAVDPMPGPELRRETIEDLAPVAADDGSIASLLDRLERGARKKAVVPEAPAASLGDTLMMLRRLAAG